MTRNTTRNQGEEFYVGYLDETPTGVARFARHAVLALLLLAAVLGAGLALLLERFDEGVFEYGVVRDHEGDLLVDPLPRLLTADGPAAGYLLVAPGKHGIDVNAESSAPWSPSRTRSAALSGTLIRNPEAAMLEVHSIELSEAPRVPGGSEAADANRADEGPEVPEGPEAAGGPEAAENHEGRGAAERPGDTHAPVSGALEPTGPRSNPGTDGPVRGRSAEDTAVAALADDADTNVQHLRVHTVVGEIVDTKCYLGAMKPGRGKPHRACASLCIRGGIPAALLVRTADGERQLIHLVDFAGRPLGRELLDWVGQPVEVSGRLHREDDRVFLVLLGAEWIQAADGAGS